LNDIFGVESEIAKGIAESLQAKLIGREEQELAVKPTKNPEAYDAYLRGLAFEARISYSNDALGNTIDFYEQAVQLDPNFAIAWARLSRLHAKGSSSKKLSIACATHAIGNSFRFMCAFRLSIRASGVFSPSMVPHCSKSHCANCGMYSGCSIR
jgi:hypothetical protein